MSQYLVASAGDQLDSKISGRFGHATYFIVIDPQSMDYEVYPGVEPEEERPDIGRFMKFGINTVIVGNIGPSAFNEAIRYGVNVFLCRRMPVQEAVKKIYNNEISSLKEPTLKESIHSPHKAAGNEGGRGEGRGRGLGRGIGKGRGMGLGRDRGMGKGRRMDLDRDRVMGKGYGMGLGRSKGMNKGYGIGLGNGRGKGNRKRMKK